MELMEKKENLLQLKQLKKAFRHKEILHGIDAVLENGVYGLLGANGAGKTTLMRCITGYYQYKGEIILNEKDVRKTGLWNIGYLPQKFVGYPELKVYQMLEYFCNIKKLPEKQWKDEIERSLLYTNLEEKKNNKIKTLSGGMLRRVGIAQAIIGDPKVILLDEPTSGLDPEERNRFKDVIDNISEGRIVLLSTHIVEDVEACCDKTIVMAGGRVLYNGDTLELCRYADGRILEFDDEEMKQGPAGDIEKTYIKKGKKKHRVIMHEEVSDALEPTVEDGYLCLLKKSL
ncbi:MAG: ATP-binding cassette domain-containing protein [Lachnospiraceae bacterium]|nr:ATP-binding cassette domain-containing protein [Lachnospiraceae bacterium]